MITLKQIEALYWVAQLGTFERAAAKLNTTQSAISKRIHELEAVTGLAVFNREMRGAKLTEKGEHLLAIGQEMLELRESILELKEAQEMPARRFRLGVTELTALTWLPRLVAKLRATYPQVILEPEVDMSRNLYQRLQEDTIDLIVIPATFVEPYISTVSLAEVTNSWMASPDLIRSRKAISLDRLAEYTILTQGGRSGSGLYISKWLRSEGIVFPRVFSSDSLIALVGLAVAGIGVTYLPQQCFKPLIKDGKLTILPTKPALPPVPYVAMFRNDRPSVFAATIANIAQTICDFSTMYQGVSKS